jgi:hypothetical protein
MGIQFSFVVGRMIISLLLCRKAGEVRPERTTEQIRKAGKKMPDREIFEAPA